MKTTSGLAAVSRPARQLALAPGALARAMLTGVVVLAAAHAGVLVMRYGFGRDYLMGLAPLFDLWRERNVPTFASALGLAFCALLLLAVARDAAVAGERDHRYWFAMGAVFLLLACDEMLGLHDALTGRLRAATGASGVFYHAWVIPYLALVALLGVVYLPFLLRLPPATRNRFLLAAVLYLAGAVGLEMVDAIEYERVQDRTPLMELYNAAEEILEMLGITVFAWALAHELARRGTSLGFSDR